ncbi:MAG: hypothetical protein J6A75_09285 [Lachnospiraceae bacterium]|nr:hypothetical protein [Lachnospiraceae bacterium]
MTVLLELKEKLKGFYAKYDVFIHPLAKFILAISVFNIINQNIGYMERLNDTSLVLVLSLLCAILPINIMLVFSAIVIVLHLYALSLEVAIIALLLLMTMLLVYFRFAPKDGFYVLLTPVCFHLGAGPVMPMAAGLLSKAYTAISVACGTVIYYFLEGVQANASALGDSSEDAALTSKFTATVNQLLGNKEMYLMIFAFTLTTIIVMLLRNLSVDYAWTIAIVIGSLMNFIVIFAGNLLLGISGKTSDLVIGTLIGIVIAFFLQFLFFHVDYTRTERVQFEDDEYYYYVKAVPKMYVAEKEKQVKKFNTKELRRKSSERINKEQLYEDMEISEEL